MTKKSINSKKEYKILLNKEYITVYGQKIKQTKLPNCTFFIHKLLSKDTFLGWTVSEESTGLNIIRPQKNRASAYLLFIELIEEHADIVKYTIDNTPKTRIE